MVELKKTIGGFTLSRKTGMKKYPIGVREKIINIPPAVTLVFMLRMHTSVTARGNS